MQRKIHNQTLFVAALSVYLGLLIIGAPPHLLAQQSSTKIIKQGKESKQTSDQLDKELDQLLTGIVSQNPAFVKEQEEIQKILFESSIPFHFAYQFEFAGEKISNQQMIVAEGDQRVIAFMRKAFEKLHSEPDIAAGNLSIIRVLYEIRLDKAEHTTSTTWNFEKTEDAKYLGEFQKLIYDQAKSESLKKGLNSDPSNFTTVGFKDNQVFIVTRLPRAGLAAALKANEKAN